MHLSRIHAVDYGALSDASLDGLAEGLNLVFGPNEAGKSTFTSLVRHVLYGFPRKGGEASDYLTPDEAARAGSLTFTDGSASWLVERIDSRKTADREPRVTPLGDTPARPGLLAELVAGTNADMFRAVFGFGLDELADFDKLDSEALRARLYTAGAGLGVSTLHTLRGTLGKESDALLAARVGKARINDTAAALKQVRAELAESAAAAAGSAAQRERLRELEAELSDANAGQQAAGTRAERLSRLDVETEGLSRRAADDELALGKARAAVDVLDRKLEAAVVDDAVLASAAEIEASTAGLQAFELNVSNAAEADGKIRRAREELSAAVAQMGPGWDLDRTLALRTGPVADEEVAALAKRLAEARAAWELERRRGGDAEDAAGRAEAAAATAVEAAGVPPGPEAADTVREREAAVDALLAARLSGSPRASASRSLFPVIAAGVLGAAAVVAGVLTGQYLTAGLGIVLVGLAVYLFMTRGRMSTRPDAALSSVLSDVGQPSDAELPGLQARLRAAADACRAAAEARRQADLASSAAERLEREHASAAAAWDEWLAASGVSGEPSAVERLLRQSAEVKSRRTALDTAVHDADAIRGSLDEYVVRTTAAGVAAAPPDDPLASPWAAVSRGVRGADKGLRDAREADIRRRGLLRDREAAAAEVERLTAEIASLAIRRAEVVSEADGLLAGAALPAIDGAEGLAVSARLARGAAEAASQAYKDLFAEKAALEAVLRDAERETRGADLRQREAALAAELADAVDRYAVVSVATALLGEAQRAYEAERQPALVRRAGDLLARFTGGRYVGLAASLDEGGGLTAIQAGSGGVRTPEQLSRGTREQLYLALRLAFIGELGDTGRGLPVLMDDVMVDFDDERKVHVATVIAEAAADRQIVLFTCHQATAELFQRVAPGHTRLDLDRC